MLKPEATFTLCVGFFGLGALIPRLWAGTISPWLGASFVAAVLGVACLGHCQGSRARLAL